MTTDDSGTYRREVVGRVGGLLGLAGLSPGTADALGTQGTDTPTTPRPTARPSGYGPLGSVAVPGAKEAVVDEGGTYAYVAVGDGFVVVDSSEPTDPVVVHENRSVGAEGGAGQMTGIYDLKMDGDLLAVVGPESIGGGGGVYAGDAGAFAGGGLSGVVVYDIGDPTAPERVAVHETAYGIHNCFLADGVVYLCKNRRTDADAEVARNELVTVDATTGEELGRWSITTRNDAWREVEPALWYLHDVWVHGDRAYLAHWESGTWVLDVSDPAAPTFVARVRGQPASKFAGRSFGDEDGELGEAVMEPPGNDHFVTVSDDGRLLGVGVEAANADPQDDPGGGGGSVHLFDNTDPTAPEPVASIAPPPSERQSPIGEWTTAHNFAIDGDLLFTAWYRGGVRVHDISDPGSPAEIAAWRDASRASFWTARPARSSFFVASSTGGRAAGPGASGEADARLYTFPNPRATPEPSPSSGTTTGADGPGFGLGSTLAGGVAGLAAWYRFRHR